MSAEIPERLAPETQPWMTARETMAVFAALTADPGASVRFVGGCVRDALVGMPVDDVDIATDLEPEAVAARLEAAGLRAVPTGLDHGTVTAVAAGRGFEITTLRRDVETDGRRAVVSFTRDWREDAARRDFTMNALSADPDGTVHDYFDGRRDLAAGRVRFVGDADTRIREDVLRILRFCRFHARYGSGTPAGPDFEACVARRDLLPQLSAERVRHELKRLLLAAAPGPTVSAMIDHGLLAHWLPEARDVAALDRLIALEAEVGRRDWLRRLGALAPPTDRATATAMAERLRLSNGEARRLAEIAAPEVVFTPSLDAPSRRAALYRLGRDRAFDLALVGAARDAAADPAAWHRLVDDAAAWAPLDLPVSGADALAAGLEPGPAVGAVLRAVEAWWIARDFAPDRAACLAELERRIESENAANDA